MGKAKKGLADENENGFILNESGTSVTVDHLDSEKEKDEKGDKTPPDESSEKED